LATLFMFYTLHDHSANFTSIIVIKTEKPKKMTDKGEVTGILAFT